MVLVVEYLLLAGVVLLAAVARQYKGLEQVVIKKIRATGIYKNLTYHFKVMLFYYD